MGKFGAFCEETSMQGFRYLIASSLLRKVIWACLLIFATVMMVYQIKIQVDAYKESPIQTSIDIRYLEKLALPAIAICNNNQYKISKAADHNVYDLITDYYHNGIRGEDALKASSYDGQFSDARHMHRQLTSTIGDMLLGCKFPDSSDCTAKDFVEIFTDFGICYALNTDIHSPKWSSKTGIKGGVWMMLNLETYEAMAGPSATFGVKIVIYNQTDLPYVYAKSIDLPTGFHSYIGLAKVGQHKIHRDDGGSCVNEAVDPISYFNTNGEHMYNVQKCQQDDHWHSISERCGCDAYNAPSSCDTVTGACTSHANLSVCSIGKHFTCAMVEEYSNTTHKECLENCVGMHIKPTLSLSTLPIDGIERKIKDTRRASIADSYANSLEARYRVQESKRGALMNTVDELLEVMDEMKQKRFEPTMDSFVSSYNRLIEVQCIKDVLNHSSFAELARVYGPDELGSAKTIEVDFADPVLVRALIGDEMNKTYMLENLEWYAHDVLHKIPDTKNKFELVLRTLGYNLGYFVEHSYSTELPKDLETYVSLKAATNGYKSKNNSLAFLTKTVNQLGVYFISSFKTDYVDTLGDRLYDLKWYEAMLATSDTNNDYNREVTYATLVDPSFKFLLAAKTMGNRFADRTQWECYSTIIEICTPPTGNQQQGPQGAPNEQPVETDTSTSINETSSDTTTSNGTDTEETTNAHSQQSVLEQYQMALEYCLSKYPAVANENDLVQLLCPVEYDPHAVEFITAFTVLDASKVFQMDTCISEDGRALAHAYNQDVSRLVHNLNAPYTKLLDFSGDFKELAEMNQAFYTGNILAMNIYYQELTEEHYIQKISYNIFMLACDIGGTIGLFLGASIMAIGELIDFIIIRPLLAAGVFGSERGLRKNKTGAQSRGPEAGDKGKKSPEAPPVEDVYTVDVANGIGEGDMAPPIAT